MSKKPATATQRTESRPPRALMCMEDLDELGPDLTAQQTLAVVLHVTEDVTQEEIAIQADYAGASAVSRFLNSDRGRVGVEWALRRYLLEAGRVGLTTMLSLARSAKSENVRQMAAADLMNRARLGMDAVPAGGRAAGGSVTIVINGDASTAGGVVINADEDA